MMDNKYFANPVIYNVALVKQLVLTALRVLDPIEGLHHNAVALHHIITTLIIFVSPVTLSVKLV